MLAQSFDRLGRIGLLIALFTWTPHRWCLAEGEGETPEEPARPVVDLEFVHHPESLGLRSIDRFLPRAFQWSPKGHWLAYVQPTPQLGSALVLMDPESGERTVLLGADFERAVDAFHESGVSSLQSTSTPDVVSPPEPSLYPLDEELEAEETSGTSAPSVRWLGGVNQLAFQWEGEDFTLDPDSLELAAGQTAASGLSNANYVLRSPSERYVAFVRDNDLYVYDYENGREDRLTSGGTEQLLNGVFPWVYWEELMWRSDYRAFFWSPDETKIAYFQFDQSSVSRYPITDFSTPVPEMFEMAYPKAGTVNPTVRLGIVSLSSRETRWVDLGSPEEYWVYVKWKPDSSSFYVQGLNRLQNHLRLVDVDANAAVGRTILEESSSTWVNAYNMPIVLEGGDFLWLSERSGFARIERVAADGTHRVPLTHGDWEVLRRGFSGRNVFVNEDEGEVFFAGKNPRPTERHFFAAGLDGDGETRRLTRAKGSHSVVFSSDGRFGVDQWSNRRISKQIDLIDRQGQVVETLGQVRMEDYLPYVMGRPEMLEWTDEDGRVFYASLLKPTDFDPQRRYPVVAYVYGEPAGQVVQEGFVSPWDMVLAEAGFLVFRFDGRGTPGRGREWLDPIYGDQMTLPMEDWRMAVERLCEMSYVDADRLGIWGWSGGGTMTMNLMMRTPGLFQAGAAVAGVTDKRFYDTIYTERYLGLPQDNEEGYRLSSPIHAADALEGALLIAHGVSDDNVHVQNAHQMVEALNQANRPYELYLFPQRGHGIGGDANRYALYSRILEFFQKHIGGGGL